MTRLGAALVLSTSLLGSASASDGSAEADSLLAGVPDCVLEWMDTAPEWAAFQVAIEDSLEAERTRRRRLEGEADLLRERLRWEEENRPSWIEQWALPLAVTAGIVIGAAAGR